MKFKGKIFYILIILILSSCATKSIEFNRQKFLKLEKDGYSITFDSEKINFDNFYINKEKINSVTKQNRKKTVSIISSGKSRMITGNDLESQIINDTKIPEFELLIIDGKMYGKNEVKNILIDLNSVKTVTIIKKEDIQNSIPHRILKNDLVVLMTEKRQICNYR